MPYSTTEVFTPSTVARLTFVEREPINKRLVKALQTPGKQIVLFGRSGGGKTTLLENKLTQTYARHYRSACIQGTTFEDLLLNAFDQLEPFFTESRSTEQVRGRTASVELKAAIALVGSVRSELASIRQNSQESTERRALPLQLTPSLLATLLGEANACWVVEDLHKTQRHEQLRVAQSMKLFMDAADVHPDVRIIVVGAVGSARDILDLDPEMWNRVAEVEVDLMKPEEIGEIMDLGETKLNVLFSRDIRDQIIHFCNGLPTICHQLCLNLCMNAGIIDTVEGPKHKFSLTELKNAVAEWLAESADSLRTRYDQAVRQKRASKYDNCRLVLHGLSALPREGATHQEILAKIHTVESPYPAGNLSTYLGELQRPERGAPVMFDSRSGRYAFESPMLHAYTRAQARDDFPVAKKAPGKIEDNTYFFVKTLFIGNEKITLSRHHKELLEAITIKVSDKIERKQ